MQEKKKMLNPIRLLGGWTLIMILATPFLMYSSNIGASGGEQKALTMLVTMITVTIVGAAIISIASLFLFWQWFKKNLWFLILVVVTLIPTLILLWQSFFDIQYSFEEISTQIDGNKITTKTEYYNLENKKIRSISIWKNGKKDSTWTTYSFDGKIQKQINYLNDIQIEK